MLVGGLLVVALPLIDVAETRQHDGVADPVADLTEEGQGLLVMVGSLLIVALPPADAAKVPQTRAPRRLCHRCHRTG